MRQRAWLAFVLSVASAGAANAQSITAADDGASLSPIHVARSYVRVDHTVRGGFALPDAYFECVAFENVGNRRVTGIDFAFSYLDAQGHVIGNDTRTRTGRFEPSAPPGARTVSTCFPFIRKPRLVSLHAQVGGVGFSDGTHWSVGTPVDEAAARP